MKRNEIDKDLTWDLSSMFQSQEAYEEEFFLVYVIITMYSYMKEEKYYVNTT